MEKSVAIVTGASQGIGRSTAIRLARDFGQVIPVRLVPPQGSTTTDAASRPVGQAAES
jgi:NAD(P)-dependent dehydrogenase (short-subunit alcohol dehydrogenase family)